MTLPKKKRKKGLVMRKLFLMLAVLLIASVAYAADATVYCTVDGNEVTVSYTASAEANIPRAFGLDIQLDNGEAIDGVTVLSTDYWVTPGSYPGTDPLGDPCDSTDTLPGLDSNGITIEMGSLHSPPEVSSPNAPALAGDLISFTVTGECNVAISGNAARGKVVFYDATNEDDGKDVVYTGCTVVLACDCVGDINGDNWIRTNDISALVLFLNSLGSPYRCPSSNASCWDDCYDINGDNWIRTNDISALVLMINGFGSPYRQQCPYP
jgi:hypothetical protein